jgi:hypothetical protein
MASAARARLRPRPGMTPDPGGEADRTPWAAARSALTGLGRTLRPHWLIVTLVLAGALLRVVVQLTYQPALIYIDSAHYLGMSRTFVPSGMAPLGFAVILLAWLVPLGGLALVAVAHHVLGLAMGGVIYVVSRRWGVRPWLAALAAAPVLLDGYQLQIEQNILSDTLFQALILAGLAALLWHGPAATPSPRAIALGATLLGLTATVRFVGIVLAVVAAGSVLLVRGASRRTRLTTLTLALSCFALPLAGYAAWSFHHGKGGAVQGSMHGTLLYARTAPIADCAGLEAAGVPAYVTRVCPKEPVERRAGPDFYAHSPRSPGRAVRPPASRTNQEVMAQFGFTVAVNQPWDLAAAIATDFAKGFAPVRTQSPNDVSLDRWRFPLTYPTYPPHDPRRIARMYGGGEPHVNPGTARFLRAYQSAGYTPGPLLAAGLLAGLAGASGLRWPRRQGPRRGGPRPQGPAGAAASPAALTARVVSSRRGDRAREHPPTGLRAACLLPAISGLGLLLLAAAFEFSWRYQLPGLVVFPLAGVLGIAALSRRPVAAPRSRQAADDHSARAADSPPVT